MPKRKLSTLTLYRRRALIGYCAVFAALAAMLVLALFIPGGLTAAERHSAVTAMNTGLIGANTPYYLLQKASIHLLGLSSLAIKLPSVLLGAVLGTALFLLLRRWVSLAIAVFTALIIFAGTTFLSLVGTGSPMILYVLYPTLLIFFGTRVLAHDRGLVIFSLLLLATIALALLTPSMVYLVLLAIVLAIANPHVRYGFRRLPLTGLLLLGLGFVASLVPMVMFLMGGRSAPWQILALPQTLSFASVGANLGTLLPLYGRFLHPGITEGMIAPLVGLATVGLALLGLYRVIRSIYTARAQFIVGWSVIAAVLAVIDRDFGILLYLPIVLLAGLGLSHLASIWYRTFPFNPYARVLALLPIGVLITGIVFGSLTRYVTTVTYASGSAELYSRDLAILRGYMPTSFADGSATLLVQPEDVAFYTNLSRSGLLGGSRVTSTVRPLDESDVRGPVVSAEPLSGRTPIRVLTDARSDGADRFYVYK